MHILLVRHAIAAPLSSPAERDEDRQLTDLGKRRFRIVAEALRRIAPKPSTILTSPLIRARQTAEILAKMWDGVAPVESPALVDGDWDEISRLLDRQGASDTVVLVGHESWISELAARLLGAKSGRPLAFRKGGVAMIEIESSRSGPGTLVWFIPPRVFRKI